MSETIIISIDQGGNISVQTQGFKGKRCLDASRFIEEALGSATEIRRTSDYYADEIPEKVRVTNNGK